ncbi:MAG: P-loop NTPase fold protein [Hespellia sp.]|nr:P-loop NTPase fold protein [Hespellia sp.]
MKRVLLDANEENILESIRNNNYNRIPDIKSFIESLDTIDGNMFISLDGRWGEGKTFYVRQIEETLKYLSKKQYGNEDTVKESADYFVNNLFSDIVLKHSYLPVYYNAWLYDNHDDPLLSLVAIMTKTGANTGSTKISKNNLGDKIKTVISSISTPYGGIDANAISQALSGRDVLKNIVTSEQIRATVKELFDELLVEKAEKLVIFIDELDRCRPSFAIEMLERIKHYFDDDRVVFVVATNKEQLAHTVSKYYGNGFDTTTYLNKFFDLNVHMPIRRFSKRLFDDGREQYFLNSIAGGLNDHYRLTLRDSLLFKEKISGLPQKYVNDSGIQGACFSAFIPIIAILDIVNEVEKVKFLNGTSSLLHDLPSNVPELNYMMCRFADQDAEENEKFENGFDKINQVYQYAFGNHDRKEYNNLPYDVAENIGEICIRIYDGFKLT